MHTSRCDYDRTQRYCQSVKNPIVYIMYIEKKMHWTHIGFRIYPKESDQSTDDLPARTALYMQTAKNNFVLRSRFILPFLALFTHVLDIRICIERALDNPFPYDPRSKTLVLFPSLWLDTFFLFDAIHGASFSWE